MSTADNQSDNATVEQYIHRAIEAMTGQGENDNLTDVTSFLERVAPKRLHESRQLVESMMVGILQPPVEAGQTGEP